MLERNPVCSQSSSQCSFMYKLIYVVLIFPKGVDFKYRTETFPKITFSSLHLAES